ncbi:MAG TPA: ABC transporter permease [Herpetosiphonaceae bacterium]
MFGFILRRVLAAIPVLLIVAFITFFVMKQAKGGPWDQEKPLPQAIVDRLNAKFGLNKPTWINPGAVSAARAQGVSNPLTLARAFLDSQFGNYVINAARGDFGVTYVSKGTDTVSSKISRTFPTSARLGFVALVFAILVGIPLGVLGALRQNTIFDYISLILATIGISVPSFVIGSLALILLSSVFGIDPLRAPEEWQSLSSAYILPGIVLGLGTMSFLSRLTRSSMLEIKRQDYVRTARAKGMGDRVVITRHMLRNALIPVVTILGPALVDLVTGSFIIETIYSIPGIGKEFVGSIQSRDYAMLMGTTLFLTFLIVLANLSVDIVYGFLDPRIRNKG